MLWSVLNKERKGEFLGKTVQIIPHVTNEIKTFIRQNVENTQPDVLITEIGGTIGDIESQSFIEAIRQFSLDVGRENCLFIHVCLVPFISGSDEYKTKPTQHSVKELQGMGIRPDIIIARSDTEIDEGLIKKIAMFCNVKEDCVINDITLDDLYKCPGFLHDKCLDDVVVRELNLPQTKIDFSEWEEMLNKMKNRVGKVTIAIVGKYCKLRDSYISIVEALNHAGYENGVFVDIKWIESEDIKSEEDAKAQLSDVQGVLIPGGFGIRGIEGKIMACKIARENKIPYFGICLGMQISVIEFARNVAGIKDANSREFAPKGEFVIDLMPDQVNKQKGGTMRLGAYECEIVPKTIMEKSYKSKRVSERHRHRYEFNNNYKDILVKNGLIISGVNPQKNIVETVEFNNNGQYFIGVQFHPEFKSRPTSPHPLFVSFIEAAKNFKK